MKRKVTLACLTAALLLGTAANAQVPALVANMQKAKQKLSHATPASIKQTRNLAKRLIEVYDITSGITTGRQKFTYGGTRGSDKIAFTENYYDYNTYADITLDTSFSSQAIYKDLVKYAANNYPIEAVNLQYDTINNTYDSTGATRNIVMKNAKDFISLEFYQVNGSGSLDLFGQDSTYYNAAGKPTADIFKQYNGTSFDNVFKTVNTYDANNNLTQNKEQLYIAGFWINSGKTDYTYNGSNQMITKKTYSWNGTGWDIITDNAYTYTAAGMDSIYANATAQGGNVNHYKFWYNANSGDNPSRVKFYNYDIGTNPFTLLNTQNNYYKYDADFNMLIDSSDANSVGHFIYETYNDAPAAISNQVVMNSLSMYPNPANVHTYVEFACNNSLPTTIRVIDVAGKTYNATTEAGAIGDHLVKLSTQGLAAGVYAVQLVQNGTIVATQKLSIMP
ncbi:MAG: hypothetical protein RLZZ118_633 [Bacteroidota bacterium]|jgi:hypothetical protein